MLVEEIRDKDSSVDKEIEVLDVDPLHPLFDIPPRYLFQGVDDLQLLNMYLKKHSGYLSSDSKISKPRGYSTSREEKFCQLRDSHLKPRTIMSKDDASYAQNPPRQWGRLRKIVLQD